MSPPNVFHVVIERPRDVAAGAAARLADAVAARFGIPAEALRDRLVAGRLRVKSNVDRATAETFATELEQLGAVCAIVDAATNQPIATPKPAPPPKPKATPMSSGLAAAFTPKAAEPDLGALGSGDFALATLDGNDDASGETASNDSLPASIGPAPSDEPMFAASFGPPASGTPVPEPPRAAPVDLFAPPDDEKPPELAIDDLPKRGGKLADLPPRAPTPPPTATPADAPHEDAPARARGPGRWIADRRVRLAAGVLVAILLGFLPATAIASMRESSAFAEIDGAIQKRFEAVYSEDDWNALDAMLGREKTRKEDERRSIAIQSMLIWALVGGGVAFVWFRVVDWDRVAARFDR